MTRSTSIDGGVTFDFFAGPDDADSRNQMPGNSGPSGIFSFTVACDQCCAFRGLGSASLPLATNPSYRAGTRPGDGQYAVLHRTR